MSSTGAARKNAPPFPPRAGVAGDGRGGGGGGARVVLRLLLLLLPDAKLARRSHEISGRQSSDSTLEPTPRNPKP